MSSRRRKILIAVLAPTLGGAAGVGILVKRSDPTAMIERALKDVALKLPG